MKFVAIGRTTTLLNTCNTLINKGHELVAVITCRAEGYNQTKEDDFAALAMRHGVPFYLTPTLNTTAIEVMISESAAKVAISVNWPTKIATKFRALFEHGVLNAHAGDLPRYRGNATPNWAILNGEPKIGLCIHEMDDGFDCGDVLVREHLTLRNDTYISDVYDWIFEVCPELFTRALSGLEDGTLRPEPQDTTQHAPLRCYPRTAIDGLIDWSNTIEDVLRLIRASSRPFAGAYSFLGVRRVIIWRASKHETGPFCAVPGQVCERIEPHPVIACADGMVRIDEADIEGGATGMDSLRIIGKSLRQRLGRN